MKTRDEILETLNDDQREVVTKIGGKYAVVAGPGSGKALAHNTPIQTPNGPILMGDIQVGQEVFGTDGKTYQVQAVHPQGKKQVWEVEFSEGTVIGACKDHLWTFQQRNNDVFQTLTTKDIHETIDLYRDSKANVFMPKIVAPESLPSDTRERLNSRELYITDIRPTEHEAEMTCITVDSPDHLFLIEDFIPTHNTHSMISRAAYLISSGVKPWEILMITFTKKAAGEISERLISYIGEEAVDVNTGTFHSVALRILLANQAMLGFDKSLTVIEEEESLKIITDLCVSHGYSSDDGAREIKDYISNWQTENLSPIEVEELEEYPEDIVIIYKEYQQLKRSIGYIDFNDILNLSVYLLEKFPNILKKYSEQYKYIIVNSSATL